MRLTKRAAIENAIIILGLLYMFVVIISFLTICDDCHPVPRLDIKVRVITETKDEKKEQKQQTKTYVILYGSEGTASKARWGLGEEPFRACSFKNCFATNNLLRYPEASAVIFDEYEANPPDTENTIPRHRPWQKWIYNTLESPVNAIKSTLPFNWSVTFSRQSEIRTPYGTGYYENLEKSILEGTYPDYSNTNFAENRTKLAVWIASHCYTQSKREKYVQGLQYYIDVDNLGECLKSSESTEYKPDSEVYERLKEYKFYLAFENSLCNDYISEKPFKWGLSQNILPVVYGARKEDYIERFPPNSFIFAEDFESPKQLAAYLKKVDKDDALYNKYFEWKRRRFFKKNVYDTEAALCQICRRLNSAENTTEMVDFTRFWSPMNMCRLPDKQLDNYKSVKQTSIEQLITNEEEYKV